MNRLSNKPFRVGVCILLIAFLSACASNTTTPRVVAGSQDVRRAVPDNPPRNAVPQRALHEQAAITAVRQVGTPYRYGGATESGFDCSGLVYYSYQMAGKRVPRTTGSLWKLLRRVTSSELRAGDVLFFRIEGKVSHVGMYLGERRFVHAPQSGRTVSVAKLDSPFYRQAFVGAGRP